MAICSYLVIPQPGQTRSLTHRLRALPGCEVVPSDTGELLILITDTADRESERALRARLEALGGLQALILTFGEVDAA